MSYKYPECFFGLSVIPFGEVIVHNCPLSKKKELRDMLIDLTIQDFLALM